MWQERPFVPLLCALCVSVVHAFAVPAAAQEAFVVGEVTVTHQREAGIEEASTSTTLTVEELDQQEARTLEDAVRFLPGVSVYRHQKGHVRMRLRGFDQDRIAVLVDGIPVQDVYATDVDLSTLPVLDVSKVVVNRGVASALYGTTGAVGSVNVVTARPHRLVARAEASLGLHNNGVYSLAHGMPVGDFYYWVTGSVQTSGGFEPSARLTRGVRRTWFDKAIRYELYGKRFDEVLFPAREQYLGDGGLWDHHESTRYDVSGKAGYDLGRGFEVGLSSSFHFHEGLTNTYQAAALSDYNLANEKWRVNRRPWWGDEQSSVKDFALRNRAFEWPGVWRVMAIPYLLREGEGWQLKIAPYMHYTHVEQVGYAAADHSYVKEQAAVYTDRREDPYDPFRDLKGFGAVGIRAVPTWRFGTRNRLSASLQWQYDFFLEEEQALSEARSPNLTALMGPEPFRVNDLAAHTLSVAVEDDWRPWPTLRLSAGVSYDAQLFTHFRTRTGLEYGDGYIAADQNLLLGTRDGLHPVVGVVWDPVERFLRLRAAASMKSRFPTLSEYAKVAGEEQDRPGSLQPERSWNANAGAELFLLGEALSVRADYFASVVDDRIAKLTRDEAPVNVDRVAAQGVECIVSGRSGRLGGVVAVAGEASYTWVQGRNHDDSPEEQVNMGPWLEFLPEHQLTARLSLDFSWGMRLDIWGRHDRGARMYGMAEVPEEFAPYDTKYFTTIRLHDPLLLSAKLSQGFLDHFEAYVLVRNATDDYAVDPFDPGPGRMVYLGAEARW